MAPPVVRLARLTQPDWVRTAQRVGRPQLLTIPYSHFCELAKFALSLAHLDYDEAGYPPGAHILPALATRLPATGPKRVAQNSSTIVSGATAVPLLALPSGEFFPDSWSIVEYVSRTRPELGSVPPSLKQTLDTELGPLTRQACYAMLLKPSNREIWNGLVTHGSGWLWRFTYFLAGPKITKEMVTMFASHDAAKNAECETKLRDCFDRMWADVQNLMPPRASFMNGDSPGLADVAVATLTAPVLLPEKYCGGTYVEYFRRMIEQDEESGLRIESYRATPLGQYCMRVYEAAR